MANPIIQINGNDQIHKDYLRYTLVIDKELLQKYKPKLGALETTYGVHSQRAKVLQSILGVSKDHVMNLVATNDTFFVDSWWAAKAPEILLPERDKLIVDQIVHLRYFFFLKMVAMTETQLRILTRELFPPNPGTKEFIHIYTDLLSSLGLTEAYQRTYNIARLIRNTIHNMGVHTSATVDVSFKENTYKFEQSKPILFLSDRLNLDIQEMLIESVIGITQTTNFQTAEF